MRGTDGYDFLDDILAEAFYPARPACAELAGEVAIDSFLDDVFGVPEATAQPIVVDVDGTTEESLAKLSAEVPHALDGMPPSLTDIVGEGPLDERGAMAILRRLRAEIVGPGAVEAGRGWDIDQSLFREAMIETLVSSRIVEEDEWFRKVPISFRQRTNPREKQRYLPLFLDIVGRIT